MLRLFTLAPIGHTGIMMGSDRQRALGWPLALAALFACGPGDNTSGLRVDASLDASVDAAPPDAVELVYDFELVAVDIAEVAPCSEELEISVSTRNSGTSTWTGEVFAEVVDTAGFGGETRAYLEGEDVAPGAQYTFVFRLTAPDTPGRRSLGIRLYRIDRGPFDDTIEVPLVILCDPPELVLDEVTWLDDDVSGWDESVRLREVVFRAEGSELCFDSTDPDRWANVEVDGVQVAANAWVFIYEADQWFGATWDWLTAGQQCKFSAAVSGEHIRRSPFDALSGWTPVSGEVLYFMLSGVVRGTEVRNDLERTNARRVSWP